MDAVYWEWIAEAKTQELSSNFEALTHNRSFIKRNDLAAALSKGSISNSQRHQMLESLFQVLSV